MIAASLHRRRGPLVRYWTADFQLVATEPIKVETWPQWARRQWHRITSHRRRVPAGDTVFVPLIKTYDEA